MNKQISRAKSVEMCGLRAAAVVDQTAAEAEEVGAAAMRA
jgi:hypothetical protein